MADSGAADCRLAQGGGCSPGVPPPVPSCDSGGSTHDSGDTGTALVEGGGQTCGCQPLQADPGVAGLWPLVGVVLAALWRRLPVLGALLLIPAVAQAVDAQHLQVADGGVFLTITEPWRAPPWSVRTALSTSYARDLVVLRSATGQTTVLLDRVLTHEVGASIAAGEWVRAGLALPLHARHDWEGLPSDGRLQGDIALWGSVHLSDPDAEVQRMWTVAVDVPSAADDHLLGDTGAVRGFLSSGRALSPRLHLAGQAGVRLQQPTALPGVTWGRRLEGAVAADWSPWERQALDLEILASAPLGDGQGPSTLPAELLLSVRRRAGPAWIRLGGGAGLGSGIGAPSWRLLASLSSDNLSPADQDQDGIVDALDACPTEPEDLDAFRDRDGCPEPDNDQDGILDAADACPVEPEVFNLHRDEDGCPDSIALLSVVVDSPEPELERALLRVGDAEPVTVIPGEAMAFRLEPGQRVPVEASAEGHRTRFEELRFLGDKTITLTLEPIRWGRLRLQVTDPQGTPLEARLGTGEPIPAAGADLRVPSGLLSLTVAAPGHHSAALEIPIAASALTEQVVVLEPAGPWLEDARLRVGQELRFALDSAELAPESRHTVAVLAAWLQAHPEIRLLRVEGLADALGSPAYNYSLSLARAGAVRDALVAAGIDPARLLAIGSGEALADPGGDGRQDAERSVRFLVIVWDAERDERPDAAGRISSDAP